MNVRILRNTKLSSKLLLLSTLSLCGSTTWANAEQTDSAANKDTRPEWTIYHGHGIDADLFGIPKQIFTGSVKWEPSYFEGIGYGHPVTVPQLLDKTLNWVYLSNTSLTLEGLLVQHRGLQHNTEADIAYVLRTDQFTAGPVRFRVGVGAGLSYAFGTPSYEDGPKDNPSKRHRFQNYNAYELELGATEYSNTSLVFRVHHRSGVYGLIAPRHVGSNFLTLGLRYEF